MKKETVIKIMEGIILSRRDFRENDQMVTLYSVEKGKMEVLARGVKKIVSKNSAHLEPCFLVEAEILSGKDISHLIKVQSINIYKNIRQDLNKLLIAGYTIDLANKFLQTGEKDERIFHFLREWLEFLDQSGEMSSALVYAFILKLLFLLGFRPELDKCVNCESEDVAGFYYSGGGVICADCTNKKRGEGKEVVSCSKSDVEGLKMLLNGLWEAIGEEKMSPKVFKIVHRNAEYHLERKLAYFSLI